MGYDIKFNIHELPLNASQNSRFWFEVNNHHGWIKINNWDGVGTQWLYYQNQKLVARITGFYK